MTALPPVETCDGLYPIPAGDIRDDLSVRIERTTEAVGDTVPPHEARWVERCRRIGTAKLRQWGMEDLVADAQLLTSELVTNALQHGEGSDHITVRFVVAADRVLIAVADGSADTPQVQQAGANDETGRGMLLVATFATEWGVSPDGTTTWCSLSIEGGT